MLKRKFGTRGPYIYKGKQINMYAFGVWLSQLAQKRKQRRIKLSQINEDHIKQFLAETNNDTIPYTRS